MVARQELLNKYEHVIYKDTLWIDLENPKQEEVNLLSTIFPFHPLNLEDCISKIQLTKIDVYEDHLFIVIHFPLIYNSDIKIGQLSIFLSDDYLVSVHLGEVKSLSEIFQTCKKDENKRQIYMGKGSVYLFYRILDALIDSLFPIVDNLLRRLDEIEDKVFNEKVETVREVTIIRRQIADLRRIIHPLRRVIVELSVKTQKFSRYDLSSYFNDVRDHIEKIWDLLEQCKELIEIYKDTDFVLSSERTNKILAILTIVFTLSIPASLLASFYGMNIPLPGGIETGPWTFLGPYTTLIVISLLAIVSAIGMLLIFYKKGWL